MTHGCLGHFVTQLACPRKHFGVDKEAIRLRQQIRHHLSAKHFQGTVTVAHPCPQERPNQDVVAPGKEPPMPGILTMHTVAHRQGSLLGERYQSSEVGEMKLAVGIRKGNPIATSRIQSRAQSSTVAAMLGMADEAHMR